MLGTGGLTMREVLFRGKTYDDEWVEGQLLYFKASVGTGEFALIIESCEWDDSNEWFNLGKRAKVDPKTIGQYTGLTDKNGKKIFEGDIVKYKNTDGIKFNGVALTVIGKVVCNEKNASFAIIGKDEIGAKHCDYFPIKDIEIIGNIHDNPELLKGGADNG